MLGASDIAIIKHHVSSSRLQDFGGSFQGFIEAFRRRYHDRGSTLQLVKMVADTFPSFRDEHVYDGRRGMLPHDSKRLVKRLMPYSVYIWKRTQILVAETWAAFYPEHASQPHPLFPAGARIHELTMFADYRVPQVLHHLRILSYPPSLVKLLNARTPLASGSPEELSIRAASIVAVERVRHEILKIIDDERRSGGASNEGDPDASDTVSSVVIDFYLWDLAKRVEGRPDGVEGVQSVGMLPIHRTRSIWY